MSHGAARRGAVLRGSFFTRASEHRGLSSCAVSWTRLFCSAAVAATGVVVTTLSRHLSGIIWQGGYAAG